VASRSKWHGLVFDERHPPLPGSAPVVLEFVRVGAAPALGAPWVGTGSRLLAIIAHLLSLEVMGDDLRQAEQRFLPGVCRQHCPKTCQLGPFRQQSARGGTLAGL